MHTLVRLVLACGLAWNLKFGSSSAGLRKFFHRTIDSKKYRPVSKLYSCYWHDVFSAPFQQQSINRSWNDPKGCWNNRQKSLHRHQPANPGAAWVVVSGVSSLARNGSPGLLLRMDPQVTRETPNPPNQDSITPLAAIGISDRDKNISEPFLLLNIPSSHQNQTKGYKH